MEKTRAILIRRTKLTESSLIVHWCSESHGIIKTVAKGARRPKSPFVGKLDLFFDAEIEFARARKGDLHILRELAIENPRLGLRASYARTQAASYCVQLLEMIAEPDTPIEGHYDLLHRALDHLAVNDPGTVALLHYEKEVARLLGLEGHKLSPIDAIRDVYKKVPAQRAPLFALLEERA